MMRHSHPRFKRLIERMSLASSQEHRTRILHDERAFAHRQFPKQIAKLEKLILRYSPFSVLATFAFDYLARLSSVGRRTEESVDIEQYHIELLQALILCHEEPEYTKQPPTPRQFHALRHLLLHVAYLDSAKDLPVPGDRSSGETADHHPFFSLIRAHTKAVRNWGYEDQTLRVLKQLYDPMEDDIQSTLGVRAGHVVDAIRIQLARIEQRLSEHIAYHSLLMRSESVDDAVQIYLRECDDNTITVEHLNKLITDGAWTLDAVRAMLVYRSSSRLLTIFAFNVSEMVDAYPKQADQKHFACLVNRWIYSLGDLRYCNREHLLLANPIWLQPIVRATSDIWFWPIPTLFNSFCFEVIERCIASHPALRPKYLKRRAEFLEQYIAHTFRRAFPDAKLFAGSKWCDPLTCREGENDLLVVLDSVALVVEAKSGSINKIARRGGASLCQEIEQLITAPAEQALAFARLLEKAPSRHSFQTSSGSTNLVDASHIRQYFCLTVTLERFGPLATQLPELQKSGLARREVPVVPTMSVADLEIALELFESPYELLHYLTRRAAFERHRRFIGDELDLLACYLRTGFSSGGLPSTEDILVINGLGSDLDAYFAHRDRDGGRERPHRHLSNWWREVLSAMESRRVQRRYELGCLLLDMPDDEQHAFEGRFHRLCDRVKKDNKCSGQVRVEAIWTEVKSDSAAAVVIAAPVRSDTYPVRNTVIQDIAHQGMTETGTEHAIVLLVDVDLQHWPYSGIYLLDANRGATVGSDA